MSKLLFHLFSILFLSCLLSSLTHAQTPKDIVLTEAAATSAGIVVARISKSAASPLALPTSAASEGIKLSGTVVVPAQSAVVVSASLSGIVQRVYTAALDTVKAGAPIATLFSQQLLEMQREYLQLETQSQLAQTKLKRDESLLNEGIISEGRLQDTRAAATLANAAAREKIQLLRMAGFSESAVRTLFQSKKFSPTLTIVAPSAGVITEQNVSMGQKLEAGMPLAKLSKLSDLWVEFQATAAQLDQIKPGALLSIVGCAKPVRVSAVSTQLSAANQVGIIRAVGANQDGCLRPNQFVQATLIAANPGPGAMGLPSAALVNMEGKTFVFVKTKNGFSPAEVKAVSGPPGLVWVTGKLNPDAQVAIKGTAALKGAALGLGSEAQAAGAAKADEDAAAAQSNRSK
jgi:membrane fusion protein, heavy metal efflux system